MKKEESRKRSHSHSPRKSEKSVKPEEKKIEAPVLITPEVNNSRAGGVYIPPFKLARLQTNADD